MTSHTDVTSPGDENNINKTLLYSAALKLFHQQLIWGGIFFNQIEESCEPLTPFCDNSECDVSEQWLST